MRRNVGLARDRHITIITESDRRAARHIINAINHRTALMEARGYSTRQRNEYVFKVLESLERGSLNEGFLDSIAGLFAQGGTLDSLSSSKWLQPIQSWLGGKLVDMLGLDRNSLLGRTVVNFVENLQLSQIKQMLSGEGEGGRCTPIVKGLAGALQESIAEEIFESLGLQPQSTLGRLFQETLLARFAEEGPLVDGLTKMICSLNISDMMSGSSTSAPAPAPEPST